MMNASAQPAWAVELLKKIDTQQAVSDLNRAAGDDLWLKEHLTELWKEYPNKFVAVYNKHIVSVGEALADAQEKARKKGIDPGKCMIQLILTEDYIWVL